MKRGKPLRADPTKTRAWQQRSRRRLPPMSPRRRAQIPDRAMVRAQVFERDGHRCRMPSDAGAGPCWGPLSYHHLHKAGRGGAYTVDNGLSLCTFHNGWIEDNPAAAQRITVTMARAGHPTVVALA